LSGRSSARVEHAGAGRRPGLSIRETPFVDEVMDTFLAMVADPEGHVIGLSQGA
jgi:hypothetical protein